MGVLDDAVMILIHSNVYISSNLVLYKSLCDLITSYRLVVLFTGFWRSFHGRRLLLIHVLSSHDNVIMN